MNGKLLNGKKWMSCIFICGLLGLLYVSSLYNYLLFHTVAEIFSVCIAFTVFLLAWNSVQYIKNNYLIVVGIAYFFIAFLDLFHTMAYKGMPIFKDYDYYANQLWIAARYFESIVLVISFLYVKAKKPPNVYALFTIFSLITVGVMFSVFIWKIFPICYIEGTGLTLFKKVSEYIICMILLLAMYFLTKNRSSFEGRVYQYLVFSIVCTIISEVAFTIYISNYGFSNLVGHYFKIFAFYLIYRAIIVKGIREPYEIIFREMKNTEVKLFEQNQLLRDRAAVDGLTGLFNHRHLYEYLEEVTNGGEESQRVFTIMILDIDFFKKINDTYGHLTGDKILRELAEVLKENTTPRDVVGRYGGEEFLVILSDIQLEDGYQIAEKIRKVIEKHVFVEHIRFTVSIGVEQFSGEKISELVEKADHKLYIAKNSGRNKTVK